MKKRIAIVLVSLLLVCAFAACDMEFGGLVGELLGDLELPTDIAGRPLPDEMPPEWVESETVPAETWWDEDTTYEETVAPDDRSDFQYSYSLYTGQTLTVLGQNEDDLGFEETSGNDLESMSYLRNQIMEESFGINVEALMIEGGELAALVKNEAASGGGNCDIVMGGMADTGAALVQSGVLLNLRDLPYLDLTTARWDAGINEGLAFGNYLPMATGLAAPASNLHTSLLLFNKQTADNYGIDAYDYVQTGSWTVEKMHAIAEMCYVDLNGNGCTDEEDAFGVVASYNCANAFTVATDTMLIAKDADNMPVFNTEVTDRLATAYEGVYNMLFATSALYYSSMQDVPGSNVARTVFEQGNTLFYATTIEDVMQTNDMNIDMGLLPYPKLNLEQENYQSYVNCATTAIMVPVSVKDTEFVGYALEALAHTSDNMYTVTISNRICRSEQDREMLNIVLDTKTLDFGSTYLLTASGGVVQYFQMALEQQNPSVLSLIKQYEKVLGKYVEKLMESIPS